MHPMNNVDWRSMYAVAEEILALAPWKTHFEEDLFAIQPRKDGSVYFVSIMGNQGEHHAIAYYPGLESLSRFRMVQTSELSFSDRRGVELILLNGHLQVSFETKRNLVPPDLDVLKSLELRYRGKWPAFRSCQPARLPWITNEQEAQDLKILMEQTVAILKRSDEDLLRPFDEEEFFLRTWDGQDSVCRVADLPVHQHIIQAMIPEGVLNGLKKSKLKIELELILMISPISDVPPGEAPYLPMMLIAADSDSGMVVGFEVISTRDGVDAAYARIPEALTGLLRKAGIIPAKILARHPMVLSALMTYRDAYGIEFKMSGSLPAVDEAADSVMQFMGR